MRRVVFLFVAFMLVAVSVAPAFAQTYDPTTDFATAITTLKGYLSTMGPLILGFAAIAVGVWLVVRWLRRGARAA